MANKRKTGGLNYSKAITFGMPAGKGRKGERPPRSRRGKQSASVVVPRNPSSSVVVNQSQNYSDRAQLHNLYPASGPPSVAAHQMPLGSLYPVLYNPPSFPIHGARFPLPYASTFQAHPQNVPHFLHSAFSTLRIFHTPHSALRIIHRTAVNLQFDPNMNSHIPAYATVTS